MARHNDTGKLGEELAQKYFAESGYSILETNWRTGRSEVDIIASRTDMLHFIEVKCRRSLMYGFPEESVSAAKMKMLLAASEEYLFQNPKYQKIQFDILAINIEKNEVKYFLIEDVYL